MLSPPDFVLTIMAREYPRNRKLRDTLIPLILLFIKSGYISSLWTTNAFSVSTSHLGYPSDQPKRYVKAFDFTCLMALGCPRITSAWRNFLVGCYSEAYTSTYGAPRLLPPRWPCRVSRSSRNSHFAVALTAPWRREKCMGDSA